MKKFKLNEVFIRKYRLYLIIVLLLLVLICVLKPDFIVISLSILFYVALLFYTYKVRKSALERIVKNMSNFMIKLKTDGSILDFPFPATIVSKYGEFFSFSFAIISFKPLCNGIRVSKINISKLIVVIETIAILVGVFK